MSCIYKICEYRNGKGEKQYVVKYREFWWWPAWTTVMEYRGLFCEPHTTIFSTYEKAEWHVRMLKDKEQAEKLAKFKIKKCTIVK